MNGTPLPAPGTGLRLSRRLFEERGRPLLARLGLIDACAAGCLGGTPQNAGLDDDASRDHSWGPYLTFIFLDEAAYRADGPRLREAVAGMPEEVDGLRRVGPPHSGVVCADPFLRGLTGLPERPTTSAG